MLCLLLAASVMQVGGVLEFEDKDLVSSFTSHDPWSPIIGDTEGAQRVTHRSMRASGRRSPTGTSGRRAPNLLESLRRQLMRDNYDYINKESEENRTVTSSTTTFSTSTTTSTTTTTSTPSTFDVADLTEATVVTTSYYNPMTTYELRDFAFVRARPRMQVASVNLPKFPMSATSSTSSPATTRPTAAELPVPAPPADVPLSSAEQRFRSFNEAYNTPSPGLDQAGHGTENKREVFKKDLLYYVDDDRLNTGLHLRRNNDISSEVNQPQEEFEEELSAQSDVNEMTTTYDTSQQEPVNKRPDSVFEGRLRSNNRHSHKRKSKRKHKRKGQSREGLNRRAKQYGLRPKHQEHKNYNRRSYNAAHQNNIRNERKRNQHNNQHNAQKVGVREERNRRKSPHHIDRHPKKIQNNRRSNHFSTRQSSKRVDVTVDESNSVNELQEEEESKDHHVIKDKPTTSQVDVEHDNKDDATNFKEQTDDTTTAQNRQTEIKQEQVTRNDDKHDAIEANVDNTQKREVQPNEDKKDVNNDGRDNNFQPYQYLQETTSNVKYKLLKVHSLGGSRRSGAGGPHHILQERGSQGVALISLDQAPFPQFQLPLARRQYMQETGGVQYPLVEQLPKPTAIAKKSYGARHHATR